MENEALEKNVPKNEWPNITRIISWEPFKYESIS